MAVGVVGLLAVQGCQLKVAKDQAKPASRLIYLEVTYNVSVLGGHSQDWHRSAAPSVAFTGGPTKGLLSSPSGTRHVSVVAQCGTDALSRAAIYPVTP